MTLALIFFLLGLPCPPLWVSLGTWDYVPTEYEPADMPSYYEKPDPAPANSTFSEPSEPSNE